MPQPARRTPVKKPSKGSAHDYADAARGERLQRVLADAGVGSRRHCEELILAGEVTVNGEVVDGLPAWVDPAKDRIVVEGRVVAEPERRIYLLLNKPPRTLSTLKDEPGADRRTVADLVDHPSAEHLFPVGRLDYDTVGLVLMTNDGDLANRLTHPKYGVPKTYLVTVRGKLDEEAVKELERGIFLAERKAGKTVGAVRTAQVEISLVSQDRQNTVLELTLREGRNRQVRRMMAAVGFPVRKLERIGMGPVRLKGVARGAWRELDKEEVWALKRAAAAPGEADGDERHSSGAKDAPTARSIRKPGESRSSAAARAAKAQPPTVQKPEPRVAKASFKPGAKPGARGAAFGVQDATEVSGPRIKRRTMKNAINRATQAGPGKKAEVPTPPEARAAKPAASRPGSAKRVGPSGKPGPAGKKPAPARDGGPSRGGKPTGKPGERPAGRSAAKPAGRPGGKPGSKPANKPGGRAAPTRPERPMNKRPRPKP